MTQHATHTQAAPNPRSVVRAFTLIELIVAIGAISLIAVGIAAVFQSVGSTVAGGRRVNQLNQYAALIERQMRSDFEAMTRDGVLVIKHDYADANGDGRITLDPNSSDDHVLNSPTQRADEGRLRRIDQLLFFVVDDDLSSARAPVVPGFNVSANEGMIIYGHGMRLDPIEDVVGRNIGAASVRYDRPQVNDGGFVRPFSIGSARPYEEDRALGFSDAGYTTNPNRFAENWALLRTVVNLTQPNPSNLDLPEELDPFWTGYPLTWDQVIDNDIQLGGQPAASTVFAHLAAFLPDVTYPVNYIRGAGGEPDRYPSLASGLVDAASTDLAEIRRIIMDAGEFPWVVLDDPTYFDPTSSNYLLDDQYNASSDLTIPTNNLLHMHAWMEDLFPVIHDQRSRIANPRGIRTRFEEEIPDYVGTLSLYTDQLPRDFSFIQNYRLTDQRMLGSSVFVPRCTEFIVEYSFGEVVDDPASLGSPFFGQLVWHGMARSTQNTNTAGTIVQPYPFWEDPLDDTRRALFWHYEEYRTLDGTVVVPPEPLSTELLYGREFGTQNQFALFESLTAHFGYTDPTYSPTDPNVDPVTVPWPWPTLIRVTMTLADPVDPTIEQTFQFVFETPEGRAF